MLSPFAIPLRTALSAAKGLRVNFAKHLALVRPLHPKNQSEILREVYPERNCKRSFAEFTLSGNAGILRFAQNDKRRAQDDSEG